MKPTFREDQRPSNPSEIQQNRADDFVDKASASQPARRQFLGGLAAAFGAAGLFSSDNPVWAQASAGGAGRIDFHHHYGPPTWLALRSLGDAPWWKDWTPQKAIEEMDRAGVAIAVISVTSPGIWFGDLAETRRLAREANEYAAKMVSDHPGRFGRYAILPLPDVDGTLKEIEYLYDTLKADGVGAMSSYYYKGTDVWLGDPMFNPVWEELNRRKAVLFTHPTVPKCCERVGTNGGDLVPGFGNQILEFAADTSRVMGSILVNQIPTRFPNLRFQFSHSGGAMPMLIGRYNRSGWIPQIDQFYYDSAQTANSAAMSALKIVVGDSQILLGTDFPYMPSIWPGKDRTIGPIVAHVKGLQESGIFTAQELRAVDRENGLRLFPNYSRV